MLPPGVFSRASMPIGVVTISTDEGVDGDVFLSPPGVDVASQLVSLAKPMLLGRDPLDIGAIWHDFAARSRMFDATVQGYIDIALWDCAGFHILLPATDRQPRMGRPSRGCVWEAAFGADKTGPNALVGYTGSAIGVAVTTMERSCRPVVPVRRQRAGLAGLRHQTWVRTRWAPRRQAQPVGRARTAVDGLRRAVGRAPNVRPTAPARLSPINRR